MAESIIDYAMRAQDRRNGLDPDVLEGRRQAREVLLEVLAEVELPAESRRRLLAALRRREGMLG
jgi:hypothetical protein